MQVSVLNEDLTATDIEIVGSQVAAYFGHALVATDVNNDGFVFMYFYNSLFVVTTGRQKLYRQPERLHFS